MKAYRHLIKHALRKGFTVSVDTGGDELDLRRSQSFKDIVDAVEACDEAVMLFRDQENKKQGFALVIAGLADDETIADHAVIQWLEDWSEDYADHQIRAARLIPSR